MFEFIGRFVLYCSIALIGVASLANDNRRAAIRQNIEVLSAHITRTNYAHYYDTIYTALCVVLALTPIAMFPHFGFAANFSGAALILMNFLLNYDPNTGFSEMFVLNNAIGVVMLTMGSLKWPRRPRPQMSVDFVAQKTDV